MTSSNIARRLFAVFLLAFLSVRAVAQYSTGTFGGNHPPQTVDVSSNSGSIYANAYGTGSGTGGFDFQFLEGLNGSSISGQTVNFTGVSGNVEVARAWFIYYFNEDGSWWGTGYISIYANFTGPTETWSTQQTDSGWYPTSGWSPDPSTVPNGQFFTQTRSEQIDYHSWEQSNLGNTRSHNYWSDYRTGSQGAWGTYIAAYNSIAWNSVGVPSAVYPSTGASSAAVFTNNGTKNWGGNHYAVLRDSGNTALAYLSGNGIGAGGSGSGTWTWTAPASPGTYTYNYLGLENGVEWFGATGSFNLVVAANPTVTITSDLTTLAVGQSTTVRANFSVDTARGDSLVQTAINLIAPATAEATVSGYGPGNLTYSFTPTKVGTHTFLAYLRTGIRTSWWAPVTVNVNVTQGTQAAVVIGSANTFVYGNSYTATATGGTGTGALVWALGTGSTAPGAAINSSTGVVTANGTGTVVIRVQRAADTNYLASAWSPDFPVSVTARPLTITLGGSKQYDGTTTPTGATGTITAGSLAPGDSIGYSFANTPSANVGSYSGLITPAITNATAPNSRTSSYSISYAGSYSIVQRPVSFTVTPTGFSYTGASQGPTITPSVGAATYTVTGTPAAINVGAYTVTATATGNYSGTSGGIAWNINAASQTVTISPTSQTVTIGGLITFTAGGGQNGYNWGGSAGATGTGSAKAVTFNSLGTYTVTVQSPAGGNYAASNVATATITVVNPATLGVSGSVDFGTVRVWSGSPLTSSQTFTLTNSGGQPLTVNGVGATGDYAVTAVNGGAPTVPFTITAGGTATLTVRFDATAAGTRTGNLTITNTSSNLPNYSASLTGIGAEGILSPAWSSIRTQ